jgi:hypothetical protein
LANSLTDTFNPSGTSAVAIGRAGFLCTIVFGGTDFATTLPAVTIAPRPIVTFGKMIAPTDGSIFFDNYTLLFPIVCYDSHPDANCGAVADNDQMWM